MPIMVEDQLAIFHEIVGAEEAEPLWAWLSQKVPAQVDLRRCTHLHCAVLQVLLATRPEVIAWPEDPDLRQSLKRAWATQPGKEGPTQP